MAVGRPGVAAWLFAVAAVSAFLAHEALLILVGQHGPRAQRERQDAAVRWFAAFATVSVALGAAAVVLMTPIARLAVFVPLALALILGVLIFAHHERTAIGEAVSAVTLASVAIPLAVASGASITTALTCAAAFASGFVAATICIHAVIAHARHPPGIRSRATAILVTVAVLSILVSLRSRGVVASVAPWAAAPLLVGGAALAAVPPSTRQLRIVGWTLVATTAATSLVLIAALRYY
jgi:YwiC-like protein